MKPNIKIAVVSDVVCPWCYIGKRRLEKAIAEVSSEFSFELAYYPYELNPDIPAEGKDQKQYLTAKFGDESEYLRLTDHVSRVAEAEGLTFNYTIQKVSPNTRNAHRIVMLAKEHGKDLELVEAFFKAYFTDGIDLSKNENLVTIAEDCGLDAEAFRSFLASDSGTAEVATAEAELQRMGIRAVPFYIINDKYGISGAQPSESFIRAFREVGREVLVNGEACDVDEKNC